MANSGGFTIALFSSAKGQAGGPLTLLQDLTPFASNVTFDQLSQGGFGSLTFDMTAPLSLLQWMYSNAIGLHIEVSDAFLNTAYEGMVVTVDLATGGNRISRSLMSMYNKVRVYFSTGTEMYIDTQNTPSRTAYGLKMTDAALSGESHIADATNYGRVFMDMHGNPPNDASATLGEKNSNVTISITAQGYFYTLSWANIIPRSREDSSKRIQALLEMFRAGTVYDHGYLSRNYTQIPLTGTITTSSNVRGGKPAQEHILGLMNLGDSNHRAIFGGVYHSRKFIIWSRPVTPTYYYDMSENVIRDSTFASVPKHLVRPGNFVKLIPPFPTEVYADAISDPWAFLIDRAIYNVDKDTLSLNPGSAINTDNFLSFVASKRMYGFTAKTVSWGGTD